MHEELKIVHEWVSGALLLGPLIVVFLAYPRTPATMPRENGSAYEGLSRESDAGAGAGGASDGEGMPLVHLEEGQTVPAETGGGGGGFPGYSPLPVYLKMSAGALWNYNTKITYAASALHPSPRTRPCLTARGLAPAGGCWSSCRSRSSSRWSARRRASSSSAPSWR